MEIIYIPSGYIQVVNFMPEVYRVTLQADTFIENEATLLLLVSDLSYYERSNY